MKKQKEEWITIKALVGSEIVAPNKKSVVEKELTRVIRAELKTRKTILANNIAFGNKEKKTDQERKLVWEISCSLRKWFIALPP